MGTISVGWAEDELVAAGTGPTAPTAGASSVGGGEVGGARTGAKGRPGAEALACPLCPGPPHAAKHCISTRRIPKEAGIILDESRT